LSNYHSSWQRAFVRLAAVDANPETLANSFLKHVPVGKDAPDITIKNKQFRVASTQISMS
jgi:hypothetical protein